MEANIYDPEVEQLVHEYVSFQRTHRSVNVIDPELCQVLKRLQSEREASCKPSGAVKSEPPPPSSASSKSEAAPMLASDADSSLANEQTLSLAKVKAESSDAAASTTANKTQAADTSSSLYAVAQSRDDHWRVRILFTFSLSLSIDAVLLTYEKNPQFERAIFYFFIFLYSHGIF